MTRPAATTGDQSQPASRGKGKQYYPPTEIVRLPSGSIARIPRFEQLDPPPPGFYGALMFALPLSIILWILIGLAAWGLVSVLV